VTGCRIGSDEYADAGYGEILRGAAWVQSTEKRGAGSRAFDWPMRPAPGADGEKGADKTRPRADKRVRRERRRLAGCRQQKRPILRSGNLRHSTFLRGRVTWQRIAVVHRQQGALGRSGTGRGLRAAARLRCRRGTGTARCTLQRHRPGVATRPGAALGPNSAGHTRWQGWAAARAASGLAAPGEVPGATG
jgi:hypothetical protein